MSDRRIRKVVILGGGTAGWMTAAALAKVNTPPQFEVTLIESDEIGIIGVGEATIPTIHWFNALVGLDEARFLRETKATFKLGIEFVGWNGAPDGKPSRYFHPFGRYGGPADAQMFVHRWVRARQDGLPHSHQDYSLATLAARMGKFGPPAPDPNSLFSTLGHAYHFDAGLYAAHLRQLAEARGVKRVEGKVERIERHPETGFVTRLTTHRGDAIDGDLFVDCSGLRALLIGGVMESGFEDWSHWLPCDRALAVPCARVADPIPYTRATAHAFGWQWRIPLQHRTGNGMVYSSQFASDDAAAGALMANLDGQALAEPRLIRFQTGRRRQAWIKNVVAIGLSSGFLEPLESTSIHLIQSGIAKLLSLFPSRECPEETAGQFNRVFAADMESVRDFLVLHYSRTQGRDEPLWRHCQAMAVPEGLTWKERHFTRTGRIVLSTDELFREASWFAVMMGQGLRASDYNPLLDTLPAADNIAYLQRLREQMAKAVATLPSHDAYLRRVMAPA
ncbi:tryptophan halogenase family protein [Nitrospirillum sp. BR 11828]|uniref:tryptophan halogenase family protein n=1 Tax=Nitrospirillum sp. BR 11828 TaxID=3104325 RepID=UPI002ACAEFAA|nr:tryptophan halogenase family protein [Nitrospirillum sp. BR 11828]MDZ5649800.1 tryptophan halogenase family protein [Nitrospirillum sp. BR 11828]